MTRLYCTDQQTAEQLDQSPSVARTLFTFCFEPNPVRRVFSRGAASERICRPTPLSTLSLRAWVFDLCSCAKVSEVALLPTLD